MMANIDSVDTYTLVPVSTYNQIMNSNKDLSKNPTTVNNLDAKLDIPLDLDLLIQTIPARYVKACIIVLKHLAKLTGQFAYRPETGEIVLNHEHLVCGTNFAECLRCLLIPPKPSKMYTEKQIDDEAAYGCALIVEVLANQTALPISIIAHPYWKEHMKHTRDENQTVNREENSFENVK